MGRRYSFICDDGTAGRIEALANEHGLRREEVLRQLVELGLDEVEMVTR